MSGGFSNPLVGGGGALVYPSIHSPGFVHAVTGWTINKDGSAEFNNLTIRGTFFGTNFIINSAGAFFYNGVPANGNLLLSIASANGTDAFGNNYIQGFASYGAIANSFININSIGGLPTELFKLPTSANTGDGPASLFAEQITAGQTLFIESGHATGKTPMVVELNDSGDGAGQPQALFNGPISVAPAIAVNNPMVYAQQLSAAPANPLYQAVTANAGERAFGIMALTDGFNRLLMTSDAAIKFGSGAAVQDTIIYRAAAGQIAVDVLIANNGGAPEVYQSLGPPGITGWTSNRGRFRFAPDGEVEFDISLASNGVAHASSITTYPNTLPANYRPAFNRAYPLGIDTTITAGDPYPRLFIGTTGTVKIAIPSVGAAVTEISGNIRMPLD